MLLFINYFSLIFCATYIYYKALHHIHTPQKFVACIAFSAIISVFVSYIDRDFPYIILPIIILFSVPFFVRLFQSPIELSVTATIISYGISYVLFIIASALISLITVTLFNLSIYNQNRTIMHIGVFILQILFSILLFVPKRLKKGMPFLSNKLNSSTPMITSLILLFIFLIVKNNSGNQPIFITFCFITLLMALFIYIYWQNTLTKTYIAKLKEKDIDDLTSVIDSQSIRIQELEADNQELAKLIHADNKLVPAMALAVESFITDYSSTSPQMAARGEALLDKLKTMTNDRKGILRNQDNKCLSKLPSTGLSALDNLLIYMQQKAFDRNIELNVSADADILKLTKDTISEEDLITITADLLDNAIIANSYCNGQRILFSIGRVDKFLSISVFDSGIPFTKEVLVDLGVTGHTTHKDDGGSGIGLITIYELTRKYRASLIIEEYDAKSALYTKRIAVLFNKRGNYILNTFRKKEEINYLKQRADLTILLKKEPAAK